ncbi:hypothetical protein FGB62_1g668 [Gracilaria domingensis]|nr:hypothetical protein FGB62_1g668 [Gracilaria domingensis]
MARAYAVSAVADDGAQRHAQLLVGRELAHVLSRVDLHADLHAGAQLLAAHVEAANGYGDDDYFEEVALGGDDLAGLADGGVLGDERARLGGVDAAAGAAQPFDGLRREVVVQHARQLRGGVVDGDVQPQHALRAQRLVVAVRLAVVREAAHERQERRAQRVQQLREELGGVVLAARVRPGVAQRVEQRHDDGRRHAAPGARGGHQARQRVAQPRGRAGRRREQPVQRVGGDEQRHQRRRQVAAVADVGQVLQHGARRRQLWRVHRARARADGRAPPRAAASAAVKDAGAARAPRGWKARRARGIERGQRGIAQLAQLQCAQLQCAQLQLAQRPFAITRRAQARKREGSAWLRLAAATRSPAPLSPVRRPLVRSSARPLVRSSACRRARPAVAAPRRPAAPHGASAAAHFRRPPAAAAGRAVAGAHASVARRARACRRQRLAAAGQRPAAHGAPRSPDADPARSHCAAPAVPLAGLGAAADLVFAQDVFAGGLLYCYLRALHLHSQPIHPVSAAQGPRVASGSCHRLCRRRRAAAAHGRHGRVPPVCQTLARVQVLVFHHVRHAACVLRHLLQGVRRARLLARLALLLHHALRRHHEKTVAGYEASQVRAVGHWNQKGVQVRPQARQRHQASTAACTCARQRPRENGSCTHRANQEVARAVAVTPLLITPQPMFVEPA